MASAPSVPSRQARAERILDVAADLMLRWGYKRVTIDDVAERAGIGKGTIYLHWPHREALFRGVIERELAAAVDDVVAELRAAPEAVLLHRLIRSYFISIMRRPLLHALFAADLGVLGKLVKSDETLQGQLRQAFRDYIQLLVAHGLVSGGMATEEVIYAVRALASGFFVSESSPLAELDLPVERKADLLSAAMQRAFEPDAPPAAHAIQTLSPRAIEIFSEIASYYRARLRPAYE